VYFCSDGQPKRLSRSRKPHGGSQLRGDLSELATMAKRSGLDTISFLLEMVRLEAESETRHSENGGG
jgi:hypothetical protein